MNLQDNYLDEEPEAHEVNEIVIRLHEQKIVVDQFEVHWEEQEMKALQYHEYQFGAIIVSVN